MGTQEANAAGAKLSEYWSYFSKGVDFDNPQEVEAAYSNLDIAIAVLPEDADDTFNANILAEQIKEKSGHDTVLVVIDDTRDTFGISSNDKKGAKEIISILNQMNTGDASETLLSSASTIYEIVEGEGSSYVDTPAVEGADTNSLTVLLVIGIGVAAVGALAGSGYGITKFIETKKQKAERAENRLRKLSEQNGKLSNLAHELVEIAKVHSEKLGKDALTNKIQNTLGHLTELFVRLEKKGDNSQKNLARAEYEHKLKALAGLLGDNNYIDIVQNPKLWDNVEQRKLQITAALETTDNQIIENIKQLNASKDLEFNVDIRQLTKDTNHVYNELMKGM